MLKKAIPLILIVVFLAAPITSADDYSIWDYSVVFSIPVGHRIAMTAAGHKTVDFGFDNFTITKYNINISASSLLDIRMSRLVSNGANSTIVEVWRRQATSCNLTVDDLFQQSDYNASYWEYREYNGTHVTTSYQYYISIPYLLMEIENIGLDDDLVFVERSVAVSTHGMREPEMFVEPNNSTQYFEWLTPVTHSDPLLSHIREVMIGMLVIGVGIGFLLAIVIGSKYRTW